MTTPPEMNHESPGPVDSRGLPYGRVLTPPDDLAWARGRHTLVQVPGGAGDEGTPRASGLTQIAGKYFAGPDCETTAPCHVCGTPQPVVLTLASGAPYAICPVRDAVACIERGQALLRAGRAGAVAGAAIEGAARARQETATKTRPKRPLRPSQARKTLLGQGRARTAKGASQGTAGPPGDGAA